jgi:hypothetical protein
MDLVNLLAVSFKVSSMVGVEVLGRMGRSMVERGEREYELFLLPLSSSYRESYFIYSNFS